MVMNSACLKDLCSPHVVAFRRDFFILGGNIASGLFLAQAHFWQMVVDSKKKVGSWWWKTRDQWTAETGLTRKQQEQARRTLVEKGYIEERRSGPSGRMHFRLCVEKLAADLMELNRSPAADDADDSMEHSAPTARQPKAPSDRAKGTVPSSDDETTEETTENTLASADASASAYASGDLGQGAGLGSDPLDHDESDDEPSDELRAALEADLPPSRLSAAEKIEQATSGQTRLIVRQGGLAPGRRRRRQKSSIEEHNDEAERDRRRAGVSGSRVSKDPPASSWRPEPGASYDEWSAWAESKALHPKRQGGGVKDPSDWNANDLVRYHGDVIEGFMARRRPMVTGKVRGVASNLMKQLGGDLARRLIDYSVENWAHVKKRLKIDASFPRLPIISGFCDSIDDLMQGQFGSRVDASNRGDGDWSNVKAGSWGKEGEGKGGYEEVFWEDWEANKRQRSSR